MIMVGLVALGAAGCSNDGTLNIPAIPGLSSPPAYAGLPPPAPDKPTTVTVQDPGDVRYYPSDEPLKLGVEHFNRGHYGTAERYFRDAVEKAPRDATAWTGLAASYDRLARFDLADRAYRMAIRLRGETPELLNNLGYSYMLRGDYPAARRKFLKALARDPGNPTIVNNLDLLNGSGRSVERNPEAARD